MVRSEKKREYTAKRLQVRQAAQEHPMLLSPVNLPVPRIFNNGRRHTCQIISNGVIYPLPCPRVPGTKFLNAQFVS